MTTKRTPTASWKPGQSGNPRGRPAGETKVAKLREAIAKDMPEIIATLIEQAKAGDVSAAKVLIERVLPPLKSIDLPAPVAMPAGTLADQGRAIVGAAAAGLLAPGQAAEMLSGLGALARLVEADELARRVTVLEVAALPGARRVAMSSTQEGDGNHAEH